MPKFKLNKLVRDGFAYEYENSNQKAVYIKLSPNEHKAQLINKVIEEAKEIDLDKPQTEILKEIADVEQALDDLKSLCGISQNQVENTKRKRHDKMGGFKKGLFVDTIELADGDQWVGYYRSYPDIFPEINQ